LLETCSDVHGVAGCERPRVVRHHLAGVHTDPHLKLRSELAIQLYIERRKLFA